METSYSFKISETTVYTCLFKTNVKITFILKFTSFYVSLKKECYRCTSMIIVLPNLCAPFGYHYHAASIEDFFFKKFWRII